MTTSTTDPLKPFENNSSRQACRLKYDFADDVAISLPTFSAASHERNETKRNDVSRLVVFLMAFEREKERERSF